MDKSGPKVRVGKYNWRKKKQPETKGFTNVLVHVSESMSPFQLRDEKGRIMENVWQFQKCYPQVYKQQTRHWSYPAETHYDLVKGETTPEYWAWREKGLDHQMAVRWPNGVKGAKECMFHIFYDSDNKEYVTLDYITARKQIYFAEYARLVRKTKDFQQLKQRMLKGECIQINEVDGPRHAEDEPFDQVKSESIEVTPQTVTAWLNNTTQPFGHGICLAVALLDWDYLIV